MDIGYDSIANETTVDNGVATTDNEPFYKQLPSSSINSEEAQHGRLLPTEAYNKVNARPSQPASISCNVNHESTRLNAKPNFNIEITEEDTIHQHNLLDNLRIKGTSM